MVNVVEIIVKATDVTAKGFADAEKHGKTAGEKTGLAFSNALKQVSTVGAAAFGTMVGASLKMAADFNSGLTTLVTGAGESERNLKLVGDGIKRIAVETGTTTKQLVDGMYMIESAGYHGEAGLKVLQSAAQGAKVGHAELGTVANAVTTILNAYGMGADKAAEATNMMVATVAGGKVKMEDLAGSISRVLPTAASLKIGVNEVGGALATMTGQGISAKLASMGLNSALLALAAPSGIAAKGMASVGLTAKQVSDSLTQRGLIDTMEMVTNAVGKKFKVGSSQYIAALQDIMGGNRGLQVALALTGGHMQTFIKNTDNIGEAMNEGGKSVNGWALVQKGFNTQLAQLKAQAEVAGITLGQKLIPVVKDMLGFISKNANVLIPLTFGLAGLMAATRVAIAIKGLAQAFGLLNTIMKANVFVAVATAVMLLAALIIKYHDQIWNTIKKVWGAVWGFIKDIWDKIYNFAKQWWPLIFGAAGLIFKYHDLIWKYIQRVWNDILQFFHKIWDAIFAWFRNVIGNIEKFFTGAWNSIANTAKSIWNGIYRFFSSIFGTIGSLFSRALDGWKRIFSGAWDAISRTTSTIWGGIKRGFDTTFGAIKKAFDWVVGQIKSVWNTLQAIFKAPVNFLINTVYMGGIRKLWNFVMGAIHGPQLPAVSGLAAGGKITQGTGPTADDVLVRVSKGETVVDAERSRRLAPLFSAMGVPGYQYGGLIGAQATGMLPSFQLGGIIGGITGAAKWVGGKLAAGAKWVGGKAVDIAKITAALFTGNTEALLNAMSDFVGTPAVGALGQMMIGIPKTIISQGVKFIKDFFSGIVGGQQVKNVGSGVARWMGVVLQALAMNGLSSAFASRVLYQMQTESGGNPNAINLWDINAQRGDPSKGLMQVIGSTFRAYHVPGTSWNIYDPLANVAAAIHYALHVYGPQLGNQYGGIGSGHGYAAGGVAGGWAVVGEHGRELIRLPYGSRVWPAGQVPGGLGGGGGVVRLEIVGGRSDFDQFMLAWIRKHVVIKGGGDVQMAFGRR